MQNFTPVHNHYEQYAGFDHYNAMYEWDKLDMKNELLTVGCQGDGAAAAASEDAVNGLYM